MEIFQCSLDISCMSLIVTTVKEGSGRLVTSLRGQSQEIRELVVCSISDLSCGFGAFTFEILFLKLSNYLT